MYLANDKLYNNPVPSKKIFQFTKKSTDIKRFSQIALKILSKKQIDEILKYAEENMDLRSLTILLLEVFTGARISEVRTILREDVHLDERFFETGFTIDARKSTLNKASGLIFFYPEILTPYLKAYERTLENSQWYFPGYSDAPLSSTSARKIYVKIRKEIGVYFSFHYFRRSLITERRKIGCPEDVSEGLMCHNSSSVEGESYVKLTVKEKRDLYDKYDPYKNLGFFKK
jgi:integrase